MTDQEIYDALFQWLDRCMDPAPGRGRPTVEWTTNGVIEILRNRGIIGPAK